MIFRDDIQKVYDLLAAPERWTQHEFARNADGEYCGLNDAKACSWCLDGAAMRAMGDAYNFEKINRLLIGRDCSSSILSFNDAPGRTHAEVLALLRSAMERAPVRPVQPDGGVGT